MKSKVLWAGVQNTFLLYLQLKVTRCGEMTNSGSQKMIIRCCESTWHAQFSEQLDTQSVRDLVTNYVGFHHPPSFLSTGVLLRIYRCLTQLYECVNQFVPAPMHCGYWDENAPRLKWTRAVFRSAVTFAFVWRKEKMNLSVMLGCKEK